MADRVPPELFEHIIHCFTLHLRWELFTKEHRQILGKWSLVSRHWAKHCRPFIFHTLTICSKEDAQMLLQLSSSFVDGCYPLGYYVTMLFLRQRLPSPPWTHFIYLSVAASLMTNIRKIDVTIEPETSSFQATEFRSTQSGLPKSYPHRWSGLAGIELTLSNFRFRAFRDIIIALDSINTNEISLRGLSWEIEDNDSQTPPDVPASVFATRWNHNTILMTLTITACTAAWPFMWYILTARPSARSSTGPCSRVPVFVEASKILALVNIARILWDDCKCATCCGEPADNVSHCFEFYSSFIVLRTKVSNRMAHSANIYVSPQGFVSSIRLRPWKFAEDTSLDTFDPNKTQFPWEALDEQIGKLGVSMDELIITLKDNEKRTVEAYIRSQMPRMQFAGKLRFHLPLHLKRIHLGPQ